MDKYARFVDADVDLEEEAQKRMESARGTSSACGVRCVQCNKIIEVPFTNKNDDGWCLKTRCDYVLRLSNREKRERWKEGEKK